MLMMKIGPELDPMFFRSGLYWNFSQLPDGVTTALSIRGYSVPECFSNPAFPADYLAFALGGPASRFPINFVAGVSCQAPAGFMKLLPKSAGRLR